MRCVFVGPLRLRFSVHVCLWLDSDYYCGFVVPALNRLETMDRAIPTAAFDVFVFFCCRFRFSWVSIHLSNPFAYPSLDAKSMPCCVASVVVFSLPKFNGVLAEETLEII